MGGGGFLYVFFRSLTAGEEKPPCPSCGAPVEWVARQVEESGPPVVDGPLTVYPTNRVTGHVLRPCGCEMAGVMWLSVPPILVPPG